MSFRVLHDPNDLWASQIGLIWLDEHFNPVGKPQFLDTRVKNPKVPSRSEDARLFITGKRLYIIYNDCEEEVGWGERRMYVSELQEKQGVFYAVNPDCIKRFEGEVPGRMEKNWTPFDFFGKTYFAYSLVPHQIFAYPGKGRAKTLCTTINDISWQYGTPRSGVQPQLLNSTQYLGLFHSSARVNTPYSKGEPMWHYFMGVYLFNAEPPFEITAISPEPIVGESFYDETIVFKKVIFPGGYIFDDSSIWVFYGRDDLECWVVRLDRAKLLESLVPVQSTLQSSFGATGHEKLYKDSD
jgi:hypothetical protein